MEVLFTIAFFTGLASSFHCLGMCGPIALALPVGGLSHKKVFLVKMVYNIGRLFTYSLFGAFFGFMGMQFLFRFQQGLSIFIGILLFVVLFQKRVKIIKLPLTQIIRNLTQKVWHKKTFSAYFTLGLLNGFLPCGMVYLALAGATATTNAINGAIFMALFGLGTVPIMLAVNILPQFLSLKMRQNINALLPVYTFVFGVFFVVRGLGLGIPYISPTLYFGIEKAPITICHGQ